MYATKINPYFAVNSKDLTIDNFTFFKEPIGLNDPEKEIIRDAKRMRVCTQLSCLHLYVTKYCSFDTFISSTFAKSIDTYILEITGISWNSYR